MRRAQAYGWVSGVTTNPSLLAAVKKPAETTLTHLAKLGLRPLFYQLRQSNMDDLREEVNVADAIVGDGLVLKIPPTPLGFRFTTEAASQFPVCITAVFSPAQAAVAAAAGAAYVAIYVHRATQLMGDGLGLVRLIAAVLAGTGTEILAASLKSPEEVADALQAGAAHITAPLSVLSAMMQDELSTQAVTTFDHEGLGLTIHP